MTAPMTFLDALNAFGTALVQYVEAHPTPFEAGGGVFFLSFVAHWPEKIPTTWQEYWTWLRSTLQTALPINRVAAALPVIGSAPAVTTSSSAKVKVSQVSVVPPVEPSPAEPLPSTHPLEPTPTEPKETPQ